MSFAPACAYSQKLKKAKQHVAAQKTTITGKAKSVKKVLFATPSSSGAGTVIKETSKGSVAKTATITGGEASNPSVPIGVGNISVEVPIFKSALSSNGCSNGSEPGQMTGLTGQTGDAGAVVAEATTKEPKPPPVLPKDLPLELDIRIQQLELVGGSLFVCWSTQQQCWVHG